MIVVMRRHRHCGVAKSARRKLRRVVGCRREALLRHTFLGQPHLADTFQATLRTTPCCHSALAQLPNDSPHCTRRSESQQSFATLYLGMMLVDPISTRDGNGGCNTD